MKTDRTQALSPRQRSERSKMNLDQYRSPSMWEKLEEWKAQKRQSKIKTKTQQPFKAGSSKAIPRKVPSKASEKMRLLSESNQKTTWSYHTSPRHLNYRKSMGPGTKVGPPSRKGVLSENRKSVDASAKLGSTLKKGAQSKNRKSMGPRTEVREVKPASKNGLLSRNQRSLGTAIKVGPTSTEGLKSKNRKSMGASIGVDRVSKDGVLNRNRKLIGSGVKSGKMSKMGASLDEGKENLRHTATKDSTTKTVQTRTTAKRRSGILHEAGMDSSRRGLRENSVRPVTKAKMDLSNGTSVRKETANGKFSAQQIGRKRKVPSEEPGEDEDEKELKSALKIQRIPVTKTPVTKTPTPRGSSMEASSDRFEGREVVGQVRVGKRNAVKCADGSRPERKIPVRRGGEATPEMETFNSHRQRSTGGSSAWRDVECVENSFSSSGVSNNLSNYEAAEEQRRQELELWLLARGKTPRRTAGFLKTPRVASKSAKKRTLDGESDPYNNQLTVEEAMDACKNLLDEGCPAEYLSGWLEGMEGKLPCLTGMESFVECQAVVQRRLPEQQPKMADSKLDGSEEPTLPLPSSPDDHVPVQTPGRKSRRRSSYQLLSPVREESSAVKYQVKEATPYFKRIQEVLGNPSDTPSIMIVTPVRRSVRLSKRKSVTFASRQAEADVCVDSLSELEEFKQPVQLIHRSNRALEDEFGLTEEG